MAGEGSGAAACAGRAMTAGHSVRAAHRHRLGRPAAGTRLRVGDDVLAQVAAVDSPLRLLPCDTAIVIDHFGQMSDEREAPVEASSF